MEKIQVVNQAANLTDADLTRYVEAIQHQVSSEFNAAWNVDASIHALTKTATVDPAAVLFYMVDSVQAKAPGALAYHTITAAGKPIGYVGVNDVIANAAASSPVISGAQGISSALSHEILEALVDPDINYMSSDPTTNTTALYASEVCDPVENDAYDYPIDLGDGKPPVFVSDFVTPAWFQGFWRGKSSKPAFDYKGHLTAPFQVAPLGYAIVLAPRSARWTVVFGKGLRAKLKIGAKKFLSSAPALSRKGRRILGAGKRPHHAARTKLLKKATPPTGKAAPALTPSG